MEDKEKTAWDEVLTNLGFSYKKLGITGEVVPNT
jgi:hypothetical protein